MGLFEKLKEKAVNNRQRIVLPESTEPRTLAAADRIIADGVAEVILIGSPDDILAAAKQQELKNIEKATIIDPATSPKTAEYSKLLYELRKNKGMTPELAAPQDSHLFSYFLVSYPEAQKNLHSLQDEALEGK